MLEIHITTFLVLKGDEKEIYKEINDKFRALCFTSNSKQTFHLIPSRKSKFNLPNVSSLIPTWLNDNMLHAILLRFIIKITGTE